MEETNKTDPARAVEIAQRIVAVLVNEDSETRQRAIHAAVILLGEALPAPSDTKQQSKAADFGGEDEGDLATFFNREENLKPSENAQLCAAYHFSKYGTAGFSLDELRTIAGDAGVVLPDRIDKTLNQATKNGKKLFQVAGKGMFKPTAAAGLLFKEQWGVKPGKIMKAASSVKE